MTRRDAARLGGIARAARLSPERRRAIAAMGFQALVDQRFGGDRRAAIEWLVAAGLAAQDRQLREALQSLGGSGAIVPLADDPGPMPPPTVPEDLHQVMPEDLHQVMPEDLHQVEADELPFSPPTGEAPMSEPTPEIDTDTPTEELPAHGVDARREEPAAVVIAQTLATATTPQGEERHA